MFVGLNSQQLIAQNSTDSTVKTPLRQNFFKIGIYNTYMVYDGGDASLLLGYETQKNNLSYVIGLTKRVFRRQDYNPDLSGLGIVTGLNYENLPNSKYFTLSANIGFQLVHEIAYGFILLPSNEWITGNQHSLIFGPTFGLGITKKIYKNIYIESELGLTGSWWIGIGPLYGSWKRYFDTGRTLNLNLLYKINRKK